MTDATLRQFAAATASVREVKPDSELRRLWLEAAEASEAYSRICSAPGVFVSDDEFHRADAREFDARNALLDHLLTEHGLTSADLKRSVL